MESENDVLAHSGFSLASLCQADLGQVQDTQPAAEGSPASLGTEGFGTHWSQSVPLDKALPRERSCTRDLKEP